MTFHCVRVSELVLPFNSVTYAIFTPRRQQEVGQSLAFFHTIPNILPHWPASDQHSDQRPQTGPEVALGCTHGRPRHWGPSTYSGCHHPPPDWTTLPIGRDACLPSHPLAAAYTDWLPHAGSQDREDRSHCWGQSRSCNRSVLLVSLQCNLCQNHYTVSELSLFCMSVQEQYYQ